MKVAWYLLKNTLDEWWNDDAPLLAAAVAFYAVFSFAPILMIAVAVSSMVYGKMPVQEEVVGLTRGITGGVGARVIQTVLEQAQERSSLVTAIGIATSLFGATAVFIALHNTLNRIWEVAVRPGQTLKMFFMKRFLSFLLVLGSGVFLLLSLIASTALAATVSYLERFISVPAFLLEFAQFGISVAIITTLFAALYKVLPDVKIAWRDVWLGATMTALLFTIGKTFIGIYLARSTVASVYGAAGSLVLLLIWIYYSVQVFFLGAEFIQVNARRRGRPVVPDDRAVRFVRTYHFEASPLDRRPDPPGSFDAPEQPAQVHKKEP